MQVVPGLYAVSQLRTIYVESGFYYVSYIPLLSKKRKLNSRGRIPSRHESLVTFLFFFYKGITVSCVGWVIIDVTSYLVMDF